MRERAEVGRAVGAVADTRSDPPAGTSSGTTAGTSSGTTAGTSSGTTAGTSSDPPASTSSSTTAAGASAAQPDEVDHIATAWRAQLPGLDIAPMHVFSRLHRLADHIEQMRRHVFAGHGLTLWQFDVLAALRRAGAPYELTPGRLVEQTHVSSGTMTNRIDRLVERGLVDRRGSDDDRRIVLVRLTDAGRDAVDAAVADLVTRERTLLDGIGDDGAIELAELLRRLLQDYGPREND